MIHRDLKPSNILVDADGVPKVLDFGLAKQLLDREQTLISVTGQVVGTLPYMSPEQARGNPDEIDIRTDVYALGVVLYEMLTGRYPYPVVGQMADVLKHIAETAPTPPSRNWTSDSGVTKRSGKRLRAGQCPIDDEVQTIVLRSLTKERERRYQSAGELARDVGRYLADEPIEAKRDSGWYVLKKQLRRYRVPVAVAATFLLLITAGLITSLSFWRQAQQREKDATEAQALAEQRADQLETVTEFQSEQLGGIDIDAMGLSLRSGLHDKLTALAERRGLDADRTEELLNGFETMVAGADFTGLALQTLDRHIFEPALVAIEKQFGDQPLVRARLLQTMGDTMRDAGLLDGANEPLIEALEIRRRVLGDDHPDTLNSIHNMGALLNSMGKLAEAERYYREALEGSRRVLGDDHPGP